MYNGSPVAADTVYDMAHCIIRLEYFVLKYNMIRPILVMQNHT